MSLLDQLQKGTRITADLLYDLFYGVANGDLSTTNNNLPLWRQYDVADHVMTGCVWSGDSYASTRNASMTAGIICIGGQIVSVDAVANRTFTASKDTYVDVDNTGTLYYTEVTNNAASPSLTTGRMRLAIIVTGASTIAAAGSIHQGNINFGALCSGGLTANTSGQMRLAVSDSLGNMICNRSPRPTAVAGITRLNTQTTGNPGGSHVIFNGCDGLPFIAQANTNYIFVMNEPVISGFSGSDDFVAEVYLASASKTATTRCTEATVDFTGAFGVNIRVMFNSGSYSGLTWLNPFWRSNGVATGTGNINADTTTRYAYYGIEKA